MDHPAVGTPGYSVTQLDPSGRVMVGGTIYQAETSLFGGHPRCPMMPANSPVVVIGWRADEAFGVVLLVASPAASRGESNDPSPPAADQPKPLTPEERLAVLEGQLHTVSTRLAEVADRGSPRWPPASEYGFGWLLLTFGQLVSVFGCLVAAFYLVTGIGHSGLVVVGSIVAFLYNAAMVVAFGRAKWVREE